MSTTPPKEDSLVQSIGAADFGSPEGLTDLSDLGKRVRDVRGEPVEDTVSSHITRTREGHAILRERVVERLSRQQRESDAAPTVPSITEMARHVASTAEWLGTKAVDAGEIAGKRAVATSQGAILAGVMGTQRVADQIREAQHPSQIPTLEVPAENIMSDVQVTPRVPSITLDTAPTSKSSWAKLSDSLAIRQDSAISLNQPQLTKATFAQFTDMPDIAVDIKKFGFGPFVPEKLQSGKAAVDSKASEKIVSTEKSQNTLELLTTKEQMLHLEKELLNETILEETAILKKLQEKELRLLFALSGSAGQLLEKREADLAMVQAEIKSKVEEIEDKKSKFILANKNHHDVLDQLAAIPKQTATPAEKAPEVSLPLFKREGLSELEKKIAEQGSIPNLVNLLLSKDYKDREFGSGTRKKKGSVLAELISKYVTQAKVGDKKISPNFFIPDLVVAGRLQELLESSPDWKASKDIYGIDVFEKTEALNPTVQDAKTEVVAEQQQETPIKDLEVAQATEQTKAEVAKQAKPGMLKRFTSWYAEPKNKMIVRGGLLAAILAVWGFMPKDDSDKKDITPITEPSSASAPASVANGNNGLPPNVEIVDKGTPGGSFDAASLAAPSEASGVENTQPSASGKTTVNPSSNGDASAKNNPLDRIGKIWVDGENNTAGVVPFSQGANTSPKTTINTGSSEDVRRAAIDSVNAEYVGYNEEGGPTTINPLPAPEGNSGVDTKPKNENLWNRLYAMDLSGANRAPAEQLSNRDLGRIEVPTRNTRWAEVVLNNALSENLNTQDGSLDQEKAGRWLNTSFNRALVSYRENVSDMRISRQEYSQQELAFLINSFTKLQAKVAELGDIYGRGDNPSFELGQVNTILADLQGQLSQTQ